MQTIDRESLMSDDNVRLASIVARYPGLSGHLDESFRKLLLQARQVNYPAGTVLFREAEPCLNFMWLIGGSVRLYKHSEDGRQVTLYRVCAGELCILSIQRLLRKLLPVMMTGHVWQFAAKEVVAGCHLYIAIVCVQNITAVILSI